MANVRAVQDKGEKAALLILDDGSKPVWTPDRDLALRLIGKPIPSDWTVKEGEYGPQAFPPKKGGGGATAYRNTKEGFEAEAAGRRRWQEIEEDKRDRRTALMQAVEFASYNNRTFSLDIAEQFYEWLRSSPAAGPPTSPDRGGDGAATKPESTAGVATSGAGGTPSATGVELGKAPVADTEPGEDSKGTSPSALSPGSTIDCDHHYPTGVPAKVTKGGVTTCRLCGMDWVAAMEGTTADLGSA